MANFPAEFLNVYFQYAIQPQYCYANLFGNIHYGGAEQLYYLILSLNRSNLKWQCTKQLCKKVM